MNIINLIIGILILFFIILIGCYVVEKGDSFVKVNEGFNSAATQNVSSGYTLKSVWAQNFYNAVGGDYITYQGNTLVLEKNGSLLLLAGNSPTGTNVIWSFESGEKPGNATSGWDSSENRYLIKLNGNEIWAAPPRSCPAPTAKFMVDWTNLYIQDGVVMLAGYDKGVVTVVWQSNNTSTCYTYPSTPSPSPAPSGSGGFSPSPVTPSPSPIVSPAPSGSGGFSPSPVTPSPSPAPSGSGGFSPSPVTPSPSPAPSGSGGFGPSPSNAPKEPIPY